MSLPAQSILPDGGLGCHGAMDQAVEPSIITKFIAKWRVPITGRRIQPRDAKQTESADVVRWLDVDSGHRRPSGASSVLGEKRLTETSRSRSTSNIILAPTLPLPDSTKILNGLNIFSKPIDESVRLRSIDVINRLRPEVLKALPSTDTNAGNISFRLKVLGHTENESKPTIVVLCTAKVARAVEQVLLLQWARKIYQPPENLQDGFGIVFGRPMELQSQGLFLTSDELDNVNVQIGTNPSDWTLCGTRLKLSALDRQERYTTIGGVIHVNRMGSSQWYCMLSGHPFIDAINSECSEEHERQEPVLEDTVLELDELPMADEQSKASAPDIERSWKAANVTIMCPRQTRQCDWALLSLTDGQSYKPNRLTINEHASKLILESAVVDMTKSMDEVPVYILNAQGQPKSGLLSFEHTLVSMGSGSELLPIFLMSLTDGSNIAHGDSGSWIVDANSSRVYGHLVAKDMFGDGYVIPMQSTFDDIADCLHADSIRLPQLGDMHFLDPSRWTPNTPPNAERDFDRPSSVGSSSDGVQIESPVRIEVVTEDPVQSDEVVRQRHASKNSEYLEDLLKVEFLFHKSEGRSEWRLIPQAKLATSFKLVAHPNEEKTEFAALVSQSLLETFFYVPDNRLVFFKEPIKLSLVAKDAATHAAELVMKLVPNVKRVLRDLNKRKCIGYIDLQFRQARRSHRSTGSTSTYLAWEMRCLVAEGDMDRDIIIGSLGDKEIRAALDDHPELKRTSTWTRLMRQMLE